MSDTRPTVAELVERLHSNIDWISKTVLQLSDDTYNREIERLSLERESAIHSLREERVDALKKLLAERAAEKEETEIRRQREKEVIDEKRAREWEEILIRRKKEDLERIRILEIEDLEKERIRSEHDEERERQREEEERSLFEKCEDEIERLENEAHRKIEEGQAELKKLDEDRKIINQQIEAALKAPAVIPKIKLRTRRPRTLEFSRTGAIEHLHKRSHTSLITPKSVTSNRDISSPGNNFEPDAGKFTPLFMNHENLDIHQTEECHKNEGKEEALPGLSAMKKNRSLQSYDLQKETIETNMNECLESEALTNEIFTGQKTDFFSNSFTSQLANSSKDNDQQFHTKVSTQVISGEISQNSVLSLSKDISPNELYRIEPEKESSNEGQILSKETSDCVHEKIDTPNLSRDLNNLQTHSISEKYEANLDFHASKTRIFDSNGYSDEISSVESSKRENKNEKVNDVDYIKHSSSTVIPEYKEDFHISIPSDETSSVIPSLVSNSGILTGGNVKLAEASKEKEELDSRVNEIRNNLVAKNEYETLTHEYVEIETNAFDSITPLNSKETSNDYMEQSNAFKSLQSITLSEVISPKDQIPDILKESISFHDTNQKKLDSSTYERNLPTVNSKLASSCQSLHSTENSSISITHLFETKILTSEKASALEIDPDDNINSLQISSLDDAATNFNNLQNFQQHPSCNIDKSLILDKNYFGSTSRPEKILPDASDYGLEIISDTRDHIYQTSGETSTQLFNVNDSAFTSEVRISSTINNIIPQSRVKSRCTTEVIQISDDAKIEEAQVVDTNIDETSNYVMKQESLVTSRVETSSSSKESIECTNDVEKMSEHSAEMSECTTEVVYTTEVIQISDEAEIEDTEIKEAQIVDATSDESSTHIMEQESLVTSRVETSSSSKETIECTTEVVYTTEVIQISDEAEIEEAENKEAQIVDTTSDESSTHVIEQESLDTSKVETSSSSIETIECTNDEEKVIEQSEEKTECTTEVVYTTEVIQISDEAEIEDTEIKEAQIVDATIDESSTNIMEQESLVTSRVETSSSSKETIECTTEVVYTTEVIQISDEAEIEEALCEEAENKEAQIVDATSDESSTHVMEEASFATSRVETSSSSKETIECTTEVVYTTEVIQISDEAEIEEALCEEAENKEAQIVDATSDESSTHVIEQESLDTSRVETSSSSKETIECTTEVVYTTEVIQISDEAEIEEALCEEAEIKEAQIVDTTSDESSTHIMEQESLVTSRVETSSSSKETIECTTEVVYTTEVIQISDEAEIEEALCEEAENKEAQIVDATSDESSTHVIEQESLDTSKVETSSSSIETIECTNDEEKVIEQSEEKTECTTEVVYTTEVIQISDEAEIEDTEIKEAQIVDATSDESSTHIMEQESLVTSRVETSSSSKETIECTTEVVYTTEVIQISDEAEIEEALCEEAENKEAQIVDATSDESSTHVMEEASFATSRVETSSSSKETIECTTEVVYTTEVIQISDEAEIEEALCEEAENKEAQIVDATSDESSTHVIEQESLDTSKVETSSSSIETIECTNDEEKVIEQSEEKTECTTEVVYTTEVIQISDEAEIEDTEIKEAQIVDATSDESSTHVIEQESLDTSRVETSSSSKETIECTTEVVYTTEVIQISDEAEIEEALCEEAENKEAQIVYATSDESSTHVMEEASFATSRVETSSSSKETIECTTEVVYTTEVIQISDEAEIEEALCEEAEIKEAQIVDTTSDESSTHIMEQESLVTSRVETSSSSKETIECTTEVVYTTEVIQISDEAEIEEALCEEAENKEAQIVDATIDESSTHIMEHELLVSSRVETSSFSIDMVECTNDEEKVSEQAAEMSECTTEVVYTTEVNQLSDEAEMEDALCQDAQIVDANTDESSTYIMEQETLVTSKVETSSSSIETIECTNDQEKVTEQSAEISECTTEVVNTTEVIQVSDEGYYDINGCSEVIENRKYRAHDISTSRGNTYVSLTMKPDKRDVKEDHTSSEEFNKCIVERDETPSPMENQNEKWYDDVKFSSMKNLDEDLSSASGKMSLDTEIDKIFSKGAETSKVDVDIGTTSSLRYKRNIDRDLNALSGWDKTSIKNSDNISNAQPSFSLPFSPKMFSNTEKIHPSIESEGIPNEENPETLMHEESQLCIDITNQNVQIFKGSSNLLETYGGHLKIESIGVLNQEEMTKDTEKLNIMNEPTLKINQIHTSYEETWSMKPQENTSNLELHEDKIPTSCVMEEFFDCYSDNSNYELTPGQDSENEALNIEYTQSFTSVDEKSNDFITHEQPDVSEDFREGKEPKSNFQQDNDNLESISEVDEICNFNIIENQTSSRPEEISTKIHQKSSDSSRYSFKADQEIFTDPIEDIQKLNHRHEFSNSISESIPTYNFSDSASAITSPSEAPSSPFHENPIDEPIISSTWRGNMTGPDYIEAQDFKAFSTVVSKKYDICESYSISDLDPSLENQVDLSDRPSEDNLTETPLTSKNLEQLMIQQKGLSESNPDSSNPSKKYPTSAQTSKIMTQQRISNTNIHENSPTSSVNSINTHTKNNTETKPTSPVSSLKSNNLPSSPFQKARALFESQQQNKQQFKQNPTRPLSGFFAHRGVGLPAYSHSPSNLHLANFRTPIMEVNETREKNEKIEDPSVVPLPNSPDGGSASALSSHSIHSTSYPGTWSPQTQAKAAYRPNTPERSRLLFFENLQRSI
ncbi:unnamed protein product [Blumeria hordei]|uniref:Uncharacterized protein n=1 Tax=Blumeria hordei TaxID=2867405 RepID=A0A383UWS1_BLUHO|nr:unnamed protein product [Blumeria hordei]